MFYEADDFYPRKFKKLTDLHYETESASTHLHVQKCDPASVSFFLFFKKQRGPVGEAGCASKAPYKNNHIFITSIFIRCVLLGPCSFLQGQTKVS